MSIVYPGGHMIMKGCVAADACKAQELALAGYGYSTSCCKTDGCNAASFLGNKSLFLFIAILGSILLIQ